MGFSIIREIKLFIGDIGFDLFLWSRDWSEEQYIKLLEQEYKK